MPSPLSLGDVRAELDDLFSVCRPTWIADFLFNEQMDSIPSLTAPYHMSSAISCTLAMTNIQCTPCADRLFDAQLTARYVIVPAYSVGHVSVGFGVEDANVTGYATWSAGVDLLARNKATHIRFVRDDKKGILLLISFDKDEGTYRIDYMAHENLASRRRVFAVFNAPALRRAVYSKGSVLPVDKVLPALRVRKSIVERRPCPSCGLSRNSPCTCKFELTSPKHPLDFSTLSNNMMAFVGPYEGLSDVSIFKGGVQVMAAKVGSRIVIEGGVDNDLISRLSRWAITDQLSSKKADPLASIMPNSGVEREEEEEGGDGHRNDGEIIDMALTTEAASGPVPIFGFAGALMDPDMPNTSSYSSGSGYLVAETLDDEGDNCATDMVVEPFFKPIAREPESDEREVFDLVNKITGSTGTEDQVASSNADVSAASLHSSELSVFQGAHEVSAKATGQPAGDEGPLQQSAATMSTPTQIAPAVDASRSKYADMGEKEKRAEMRRQRNREAAQRSNMRRKTRNDTLKNALRESHARATELRARELVLREENLRLRRMAS